MNELSVLIPTYNRPSSLNRTLESLDNQTYEKDFICLISDNNSSEETKKIVDYWTKRDTKFEIQYYKQKNNLLPVDNWEFLIQKSTTKYTKILFDDDWIKPTFLNVVLEKLKSEKASCVVTNIDIFIEKNNSKETRENYFQIENGFLSCLDIVNHFAELGPRINVSPSASIMVSDKLKEAFYYSLKNTECTKKVIGNDLVMNYYYLFNSDKVFYINESLAVCGANDDSITVSTDDRYLFYCYLNTLIGLINDFNIELPKEQGKNLRKKLNNQKIRSIFRKEYKKLITHKLNV